MKKIYFSLVYFILIFTSCIDYRFTGQEKALINSGTGNEPFRVLQITDKNDSVILRSKSIDVEHVKNNKELQLLILRLKATMEKESGVGIAAPQVGILRNVFLFTRIDKQDFPVQVAINPRIKAYSKNTVCFERDGCLSIPDVSGNSERYEWIEVIYQNENGDYIREYLSGTSRFEDFTGVIFQHEFDHLNGILFTDKLCEINLIE